MNIYDCVSDLEKELQAIELNVLKPADKGLLVLKIKEGFDQGELEDPNIIIGALEQIALSLIPVPAEPIEIVQGRKIYMAYPWRDYEIVLAEYGNEFVTWKFWRDKEQFEYGHYFHQLECGSRTKAYLKALDDFRQRFN
jgi:hypothetical protein